MKQIHSPIFAMAAFALAGTGCLSTTAPFQTVQPVKTELASVTDANEPNLTDLTINVLPERSTQGTGEYATGNDGYVEMRMMYTEGVVRCEGVDYHIGLDSDGATGYKLNIGTPSFNIIPVRYYNASPSRPEYPILPNISALPSTLQANVATNSVLDGAYYLGRGIYTFPAFTETDPAFDILWYDPADPNNSNYGYYNYRNDVTSYGSLSDPGLANASASITAAANSFKTVFQGTSIVYRPNMALPATASAVINPSLNLVSLNMTGNGAMQAVAYALTGPDGTKAKAVYYKLLISPKVQSVKFPHLPLGRLVLDVRRYNSSKVLGNYGYRQFMLAPYGNELSVDEIANIVSLDPVSITL